MASEKFDLSFGDDDFGVGVAHVGYVAGVYAAPDVAHLANLGVVVELGHNNSLELGVGGAGEDAGGVHVGVAGAGEAEVEDRYYFVFVV